MPTNREEGIGKREKGREKGKEKGAEISVPFPVLFPSPFPSSLFPLPSVLRVF
jgi:hypothetical protein